MRDSEQYCEHHKPSQLGYLAWHEFAKKRGRQKYDQILCPNCKRYLFPDELNEPDNSKSIKVIERHQKYLEEHPKAKSVVYPSFLLRLETLKNSKTLNTWAHERDKVHLLQN